MENEYISDLDGVWTPSYFTHVSITTSIAPALKNYCNYIQSLLELVLEAPTDFFMINRFWIQMAVSEVKGR
jgi:hypothetical protein